MLILFESFLGILLLDPRFFFHHIVAQVRASIGHFENSSPLLWNPRYSEKGNLPDPFVHTFSFVMPFSYESEHTKLMTSLIINLSLAVFHRQSLSCEVIDKSQVDFKSPNSKYSPLCPPCQWSISVALLLFEVSTSNFCVLISPLHSLHTICFRIFAAPVV